MRLNHPLKTDGGGWHPVTACPCPLYSKETIKQVPRKSNTSKTSMLERQKIATIPQLYALFVSAFNAENLESQKMFVNKVIQPCKTRLTWMKCAPASFLFI